MNRKIHIRAEISKNRKEHIIPINDVLYNELVSLKEQKNHEYVFVYSYPKIQKTKKLNHIAHGFRRALKRANIEDFRFHDLRHTFATRLRESGADPFIIKELLNHSGLNVTNIYVHANFQHQFVAVNQLNVAANKNVQIENPVTQLLLEFFAEYPDAQEKFISYCESNGYDWQRYGDSNPGLMAENHLS